MNLKAQQHWVFDMDGTLTVAVHDFAAIRQALGIPAEEDILGHLAALPAEEAERKHAWLLEHERELAVGAQAAPGAVALVRALHARGCRLAVLTRNARELAHITLAAIGVDDCFDVADIYGRDEAAPKPDPEGLHLIARQWGVAPQALVMVGDYRIDLACGRAATAGTVLVNLPENPWPDLTDAHFTDCAAMLEALS